MNRVIPYLLGPELYWRVVCALLPTITRRHHAPDPAITATLDRFWAVLPLVIVPLTFALFLVPGTGRWWLLLRIDLAIAVGIVVASNLYCAALTHHQPSAGPGAGTGFMVMIMLGYVLMLLGTVAAAIVLWWKSRASV